MLVNMREIICSAVEQWFRLSPLSEKIVGSPLNLVPFWVEILSTYECTLSLYSGFLSQTKNMHVSLIGNPKLSFIVVERVSGCLSSMICFLAVLFVPFASYVTL